MIKELTKIIIDNKITPFDKAAGTVIKPESKNLFITKDAKLVHQRTIRAVSEKFVLPSTDDLWHAFPLTDDPKEILRRQEFFHLSLSKDVNNNSFLKSLKKPKSWWKPKYGVVVATEDEKTYLNLTKADCPAQLLLTDNDLMSLESYDLVQVVDCDNFSSSLERLPQSVFLSSSDDAYLERYLELLSSWSANIDVINSSGIINERILNIVSKLSPALQLLKSDVVKKISLNDVDSALERINEGISMRLELMNLSGASVFSMLSQGKIPKEVLDIIESEISNSGIPTHLLKVSIPVRLDDSEFERFVKSQDSDEFTSIAEKVKLHSELLRAIPSLLSQLSQELLLFDFFSGIKQMIRNNDHHPSISEKIHFNNLENLFLEKPQPINFYLDNASRCSILTGANSGGKTTLIEHLIQAISIMNLGLPMRGGFQAPLFSEIYYFAKNKGSMTKGAFETLLTQMSDIKTSNNKTLILADEIEAVTEPGVASRLICATAEFFIKKGCFMIVATHLGQEIKDHLPPFSRIDGIEAKGLSADNELIVDHNPVIGRLARSTPELIIEKMARGNNNDYLRFLGEKIKS
ncbi:MAG: hypothetical protein AABW73_01885 [Nanoarchaeota archaeon]